MWGLIFSIVTPFHVAAGRTQLAFVAGYEYGLCECVEPVAFLGSGETTNISRDAVWRRGRTSRYGLTKRAM